MITPTWRPVVGYEGFYEVSNAGQVRRVSAAQGTRAGLVLAQTPAKNRGGYMTVGLHRPGFPRKVFRVHRLVAAAFLGPTEGLLVRHLDGDPTNNCLENLRWGDASENAYDRVRHGRNSTVNQNSFKTHCKHGHEFTPENTRIRANGSRQCKACWRVQRKATKARARARAAI